jgi:hypothetical protein
MFCSYVGLILTNDCNRGTGLKEPGRMWRGKVESDRGVYDRSEEFIIWKISYIN